MNTISITPINYTKQATKIQIIEVRVNLNVSATVFVNYLDSNDISLYTTQVVIDGEDYANWGLDDEYLINIVLEKLNLTTPE